MSFITHLVAALVGGFLTAHGLAPEGAKTSDLAILGAVFGVCHLLPDFEYFLRRKGTISQLTQRGGMTHSLLAMLVLPWLFGAAGLGGGLPMYLKASIAGLIGYGTHLLLDVLAPYPVALFWPLPKRICAGVFAFHDWGLVLFIAMAGFFYGNPKVAAIVLAGMVGLYLAIRVGFLLYARNRLPFFTSHLGREKIELIAWVPDTFQPWVWKVAIKTDEAFHALDLDVMTSVKAGKHKVSRREAGLVRRARAVELVRELDAFTPFLTLEEQPPEEGQTRSKVIGYDLRYYYYGKANPLRIELTYDGNKLLDTRML